jgi:hypothetical protein
LEETEGNVLGGCRRECFRMEMNCLTQNGVRELKEGLELV